MKKYNILLCDAPWRYNARNNKKTKFGGGAGGHYDTMTVDELCNLNVQNICEDSSVLFMWATFPRLKEAIKVGEAWGFTYKTLGFSWIKTNKGNGKPFFGVGYYSRSNCEVCLLFTRGKVLKPVSNYVSSCVIAQRQRHSKKPEEVRKRIEQLYEGYSMVELFSREKVEGWDCVGNEIDGKDIREILK